MVKGFSASTAICAPAASATPSGPRRATFTLSPAALLKDQAATTRLVSASDRVWLIAHTLACSSWAQATIQSPMVLLQRLVEGGSAFGAGVCAVAAMPASPRAAIAATGKATAYLQSLTTVLTSCRFEYSQFQIPA